jgi:hypothetical protein
VRTRNEKREDGAAINSRLTAPPTIGKKILTKYKCIKALNAIIAGSKLQRQFSATREPQTFKNKN